MNWHILEWIPLAGTYVTGSYMAQKKPSALTSGTRKRLIHVTYQVVCGLVLLWILR